MLRIYTKRWFVFFLLAFSVLLFAGCVDTIEEKVVIIKGDITLTVSEQTSLVANYDNIEWTSSDPSIASVIDGIVSAVKVGEVTIRGTLLSDFTVFDEINIKVVDKLVIEVPVEPEPPIVVDVKLGIDLIDKHLDFFEGKRVGLITNPTGINSEYVSTIDVLNDKVNLVALFSPEHGIRGNLQAGAHIGTYNDEKTGLPVYSLYGSSNKPTEEMLAGIDVLCIDLQDAGARFYTFIYTMAYAMEACAEYGKEFVVFDRPNPIGGEEYEGNILELEYRSFIGYYPIVQRHGMTMAELAILFNVEYEIGCSLKIIEMEGWDRASYYDELDLPWVIPSPNFPSIETAVLYPGTCIFEGTNISEGRGTTIPFQVIGAPYIDAEKYTKALNNLNLPGVIFRPAYFTPTFSKHQNILCNGVQVHVTDRDIFKAVKTGWAMLDIARKMYPADFAINNASSNKNMINLNTGTNYISQEIYTLEHQFVILEQDTATFGAIRENYLIYPYKNKLY